MADKIKSVWPFSQDCWGHLEFPELIRVIRGDIYFLSGPAIAQYVVILREKGSIVNYHFVSNFEVIENIFNNFEKLYLSVKALL